MATPAVLSIEDQIKQLEVARNLVLGDASFYGDILNGIRPIIGPYARVELRRWGADFLAEAFASPTFVAAQKETLCLTVLDTLKDMIENPQEDAAVVKSIVQAAASIYPLVFRWTINNGWDKDTWNKMIAIKLRILRIWDTAPVGIRMCCVKFAQRVVMVQTPGPAADPKRGDPFEVSLSLVPSSHDILSKSNLEAEAFGLLDRILSIFQDSISDAVMVDATLNSLSILIRSRPSVSNKILNVILNFNPLKQANSPMTPKLRVQVKSMEKTTRLLLTHIYKRDPQNPLAPRIQQYIERMVRSKTEIFDEASRKRGPPEPVDGLDAAKRQKLRAEVVSTPVPKINIPPLTPGPHTVAELFTLTTDDSLKSFDVSQLAEDMVVKIGISILRSINADTLNQTLDGIRQRYDKLAAQAPTPPPPQVLVPTPTILPLAVEEDEDDYDPDYYNAEDTEQILNKLDAAPPKDLEDGVEKYVKEADREIKQQESEIVERIEFTLRPAPPLTAQEATQCGEGTVGRVFEVMKTLGESGKKAKTGLNRLAASEYDRDAWITIITRLATRTSFGALLPKTEAASLTLSDNIREGIYTYILEDFRKRIDVAIAWLCEEWYNDKIQERSSGESTTRNYQKWVLKVLDGIIPYLDKGDKVVVRFLGELPALSSEILDRVKALCRDPSTVSLALTALLYLVMMRPPAKEQALDALEDIWNTYDDAKATAAKYISKYRPDFAKKFKREDDQEPKPKVEPETIAT